MTIYCAVVGEAESAFGIDIDEGESVGQLKQAIKERDEDIHVPSHRLKLFLAKKNDVWLTEIDVMEGVSDITDLEPLEAVRASLRSVGLSDEDVGGVDETDAAAGEGPVNVLVMVPELYNVPSPVMALFDVMLPHVLTHAPTTESDMVIEFKMELCEFYGCYSRHRTWVRCMLLDVAFPQSLVSASHLFRNNNEFMASLIVQLSDIDDVKNGLLLFKPLKHAFDHFQLSFILDDANVFRLKLFGPNIRNTRLFDLKDCDNENVLSMEEMGVLDGKSMRIRYADNIWGRGWQCFDVHWVRATVLSLFKPTSKTGTSACLAEALDRRILQLYGLLVGSVSGRQNGTVPPQHS